MFSLPQFCCVVLRSVLALSIWSGFSVFQNWDETSAQVARAYDFHAIKDPKSVTITISASEYAFRLYHYSLRIHGDGMLEYYGHFGTLIPGLHRSHLSESEILRLLDAFRDAELWSQAGQRTIASLPLGPHTAHRRSELQTM